MKFLSHGAGLELKADGHRALLGSPRPRAAPGQSHCAAAAPSLRAPSHAAGAAGSSSLIRTTLSDVSFLCVCTCVCVCPGLPSTYSISFGNDTRYFAPTRSVWSLPLFSLSPSPRSFAFCSLPPFPFLSSSLISSSLGSSLFSSGLCLKSDPSPRLSRVVSTYATPSRARLALVQRGPRAGAVTAHPQEQPKSHSQPWLSPRCCLPPWTWFCRAAVVPRPPEGAHAGAGAGAAPGP